MKCDFLGNFRRRCGLHTKNYEFFFIKFYMHLSTAITQPDHRKTGPTNPNPNTSALSCYTSPSDCSDIRFTGLLVVIIT